MLLSVCIGAPVNPAMPSYGANPMMPAMPAMSVMPTMPTMPGNSPTFLIHFFQTWAHMMTQIIGRSTTTS